AVQGVLDALADAAAAAVTFAVAVDGRLAYHEGRTEDAHRLLTRAAELARIAGHPSQRVYVLIALADAHLAAGDRTTARSVLAEARETVRRRWRFRPQRRGWRPPRTGSAEGRPLLLGGAERWSRR
ncbi:MAG TPA: hypothetical protein VE476_08320, partial [Propionibacteriaceae bacterium]|nr:hypothetical protein [Propionibacteriaceae bacterium]